VLQIENEYYSLVRPKRSPKGSEKPSRALRERGVEYVEIRALDLSSADPLGVHEPGLRWLETLLIFCLLERSPLIDDEELQNTAYNELTVALRGREPGLLLLDRGRKRELRAWACEIFDRSQGISEILDGGEVGTPYQDAWRDYRAMIEHPEMLPSARMLATLRDERIPFAEYGLRLSRQHRDWLSQQTVAPDRRRELSDIAADSLRRQAELEAQPQAPFDEYLHRYLAED
jgi:glutamate--cysteine ligase